jgi:Tfp pilus assembly protein PilO
MKNTKTAVIVIFILVVAVFGYLLVNEIGNYKQKSNEIIQLEKKIAEQKGTIAMLKGIKNNIEKAEQQYDILCEMLPDEPFEDEIVFGIQGYAINASVKLNSINFLNRVDKNDITEMPMDLSFSGDYMGFLKLINSIMHGDRLIRIDGINIRQRIDGELIIDMKATAFVV